MKRLIIHWKIISTEFEVTCTHQTCQPNLLSVRKCAKTPPEGACARIESRGQSKTQLNQCCAHCCQLCSPPSMSSSFSLLLLPPSCGSLIVFSVLLELRHTTAGDAIETVRGGRLKAISSHQPREQRHLIVGDQHTHTHTHPYTLREDCQTMGGHLFANRMRPR